MILPLNQGVVLRVWQVIDGTGVILESQILNELWMSTSLTFLNKKMARLLDSSRAVLLLSL